MEFVLHLQLLLLLIWDVPPGIGLIKNVLPAQAVGYSTPREHVSQFLTYVKATMLQELVLPVMSDTIWSMVLVSSQLLTTLNQLI
jgi:hypothetical protein